MIVRITGRQCIPQKLPCGCPTMGSAQAIGLDGEVIKGCIGLNTKNGWMRLQRWVLDPSLLVKTGRGLVAVKPGGTKTVDVVCPFELRCKTHGPVRE